MIAAATVTPDALLTEENYDANYLRFNDRQAGVSLVYDLEEERFYYNVYCMDLVLTKELFSVECEFLTDALELVHQEFGTWELVSYEKKGCSDCAAK